MIYVSGPMTGLPDLNRPAFNAAADSLRSRGFKVFNPASISLADGATWSDYMREAIVGLMACKAVLLLDEWESSRWAQIEYQLAEDLGISCFEEIGEVAE